jgi:hypothetical protein
MDENTSSYTLPTSQTGIDPTERPRKLSPEEIEIERALEERDRPDHPLVGEQEPDVDEFSYDGSDREILGYTSLVAGARDDFSDRDVDEMNVEVDGEFTAYRRGTMFEGELEVSSIVDGELRTCRYDVRLGRHAMEIVDSAAGRDDVVGELAEGIMTTYEEDLAALDDELSEKAEDTRQPEVR